MPSKTKKVYRDAETGQFTKKSKVIRHPDKTTTETRPVKKPGRKKK